MRTGERGMELDFEVGLGSGLFQTRSELSRPGPHHSPFPSGFLCPDLSGVRL